jgi:hypothetical protein
MQQRKLEYTQGKNDKISPRERKEKVSSSAVFNKFDII